MGLAASQARFLGITARKSNVEYEGQQVNQQRTALAEEVNSLYNKLLALDVPVAPDATQYYESNYSFSVSNTSGYDGEYLIKSYYQNDDGTYYLNTERTYKKNVAEGTVYSGSAIGTKTDADGNTKYTFTTTDGTYELTAAQNSTAMKELINATYPDSQLDTSDELYCYKDDNGLTHYVSYAQIQSAIASPDTTQVSSYISTNKSVTENIVFEQANVTFDDNNRMSGISGAKNPSTGDEINFSTEVNATRTYNSDGYDAALRDYTMSKEEYNKAVADLNAQTESLQQEDKILELRLNQIDTEQNSLQTELEAVKKVLEKNIENTFKTFA